MIINITRGSNSYIRDIIYHNIMLSSVRGTITSNNFITRFNEKNSHGLKAMEGALDSSYDRHVVEIYNLSIYKQEKAKRCNQCLDAAMGRCLWCHGGNNDGQWRRVQLR